MTHIFSSRLAKLPCWRIRIHISTTNFVIDDFHNHLNFPQLGHWHHRWNHKWQYFWPKNIYRFFVRNKIRLSNQKSVGNIYANLISSTQKITFLNSKKVFFFCWPNIWRVSESNLMKKMRASEIAREASISLRHFSFINSVYYTWEQQFASVYFGWIYAMAMWYVMLAYALFGE